MLLPVRLGGDPTSGSPGSNVSAIDVRIEAGHWAETRVMVLIR
jgi:hypothetical protein